MPNKLQVEHLIATILIIGMIVGAGIGETAIFVIFLVAPIVYYVYLSLELRKINARISELDREIEGAKSREAELDRKIAEVETSATKFNVIEVKKLSN